MRLRFLAVIMSALYCAMAVVFFGNICEVFREVPGYQCMSIEPAHFTVYIILALIPAFVLPTKGKRPSILILWFAYFTHLVPSVIMYPYLMGPDESMLWPLSISVSYFFAGLITYILYNIRINVPRYSMSPNVFLLTLILLLVLSVAQIVLVFGFNPTPPSIDDVYRVRSNYKAQLQASGSVLAGYVATIGGYVLSPLALILGVRDIGKSFIRSIVLIALSILLSFTIYSASGFKSVAFISVVVFLGYISLKNFKNYAHFLYFGVPLAVFFIFMISELSGLEMIFNHWFRRVFMVPGMDVTYFYDYVSSRNLNSLALAPQIVANQYYLTDGSANAGLFGDGFAKGRYVGVFFNIALLIVLLRIVDEISKDIESSLAFAMFIPASYAISNSSLTTVLVTYGLFAICLLFLIGRKALKT